MYVCMYLSLYIYPYIYIYIHILYIYIYTYTYTYTCELPPHFSCVGPPTGACEAGMKPWPTGINHNNSTTTNNGNTNNSINEHISNDNNKARCKNEALVKGGNYSA